VDLALDALKKGGTLRPQNLPKKSLRSPHRQGNVSA
jgi:hypothetical protein